MSGGEPGRSLYQDIALLLHLTQLAAQARELLALLGAQALLAEQRRAAITRILRDPVGNGLPGRAKFA